MQKKQDIIAMSNVDFDNFMCQKFSELFQNRNKSIETTCMAWGFEIPQVWQYLIFELCEKLDIIRKYCNINIIVDQVKEKFGILRFYYTIEYTYKNLKLKEDHIIIDNIICNLISTAEEQSAYICNNCGSMLLNKKTKGFYNYCVDCSKLLEID